LWETLLNQTAGIISSSPLVTEVDEAEDPSPECELRTMQVEATLHGERLDRALVHGVGEFSRSYLQQLVDAGAVQLNGKMCSKPSQRVKAGDILAIELQPTPQSQAFKAEDIPIEVVYSDAHVLVLNKPPGLVVHPAPGNWSGTLLNALLGFDPACVHMPRAGIVHRLDKDTSGLMVVARTRQAMDALVQAIAAREVSRQYLALGAGPWKGAAQVAVEAPIGRDPRNRLRMAVVDLNTNSGKPARTDVFYLANSLNGCFVRCVLHTGRTHQIRVHMASLGHPLIADTVYGGHGVPEMQRQALHAYKLAFKHPVTLEALHFECPPPPDFLGLLGAWGLSYNSAQWSSGL
jgi:23S rRNA pseudouridine1911/1915/1917 synthase